MSIPLRQNGQKIDASWFNTLKSMIDGFQSVSGSKEDPLLIVAADGITASSFPSQFQFIEGSGGPVDVTANPQISTGATIGQRLSLVGTNDTNTVSLEDGNGLSLNGNCILGEDCILNLFWDGTNWVEEGRDIK